MAAKVKPNKHFWYELAKLFPELVPDAAITALLKKHAIIYSIPSKGCYKINVDTTKCNGVMFYPKTGKVVIQTLDNNKTITKESNYPLNLMTQILEYV
jgi:hypothetical protein